ncbi:ParB/RepB/Spo0J family partition protein [Geitlerinema sp. CS-897]|nr:ParB/RepB/Spo0J family partition protein [Geitlerinema sp. CS-897]
MTNNGIDAQERDKISQLKETITNLKSRSITSVEVPVDRIMPLQLPENIRQPRLYFDSQKMELLKNSIRKHGVLEPILLRPSQNQRQDRQFEIISGERRWRCCQAIGVMSIPSIVREMPDSIALEAAIVAHLLNEEISIIEQTESILNLLSLKLDLSSDNLRKWLYQVKNSRTRGIDRSKISSDNRIEIVREILNEFGMKLSSFVSNRLPLLNLAPTILTALRSGKISPTNALLIDRQPQELHEFLISQAEGKTKSDLIKLIKSQTSPDRLSVREKDISDRIYERIKSIKNKSNLLDRPEVINRLNQIDLLLKEIESL